MKPDVLAQTVELEKQRQEMQKQMAAQGQGQIMIQRNGEPPKALNQQEIVQLLESQKKEIDARGQKIQVLEGLVAKLREELKKEKTASTKKEESSPAQIDKVSVEELVWTPSKRIPEVRVPLPLRIH